MQYQADSYIKFSVNPSLFDVINYLFKNYYISQTDFYFVYKLQKLSKNYLN